MDMTELNVLLDNIEIYFHESGSYYDTDYERYLERAYERVQDVYQLSLLEF